MASPIRPQYFCTRPNGVVTPLIAVDELPSQISIRGAPRTLQPDQMQGMTSLGTVAPRSPQTYVVDTAASTSPRPRAPFTPRRAQDPDQQALLARLLTDEALPESVRLAITTLQEYGLLQSFTLSAPSSSKWMVSSGGGGGGGAGHGGSRQVCVTQHVTWQGLYDKETSMADPTSGPSPELEKDILFFLAPPRRVRLRAARQVGGCGWRAAGSDH